MPIQLDAGDSAAVSLLNRLADSLDARSAERDIVVSSLLWLEGDRRPGHSVERWCIQDCGFECGRDDGGHVVFNVRGYDFADQQVHAVTLSLSEDAAMRLSEAVRSCVFSKKPHFKMIRRTTSVTQPIKAKRGRR